MLTFGRTMRRPLKSGYQCKAPNAPVDVVRRLGAIARQASLASVAPEALLKARERVSGDEADPMTTLEDISV